VKIFSSWIYLSKYAEGRGDDTEQQKQKKVQGDNGWSVPKSFPYKSPLINLHDEDKSSDMPETT